MKEELHAQIWTGNVMNYQQGGREIGERKKLDMNMRSNVARGRIHCGTLLPTMCNYEFNKKKKSEFIRMKINFVARGCVTKML
jgi:hypothetical protein